MEKAKEKEKEMIQKEIEKYDSAIAHWEAKLQTYGQDQEKIIETREYVKALKARRAEMLASLDGVREDLEAENARVEMSQWTPEKIIELLDRIPTNQLHRPLKRLWDRQTQDEKVSWETRHLNAVGFNAYDAGFAGKMVEWWGQKGFYSPKQSESIRKMLKKYRKQLAEIANETNQKGH